MTCITTHVLDIHICKLTEFSLIFVSFFDGIFNQYIYQLNEPITKELHINPVYSKCLHSGIYMFKHKGH